MAVRMTRMQYHCTYFDRNYLFRGLALYQSLRESGADFTLWALCLDDESHDALTELAWPGLAPVSLADLEAFDPELVAVRPSRTRIEYYFTLTPALPTYLLAQHPDIDVISYLDADLVFYSNPTLVLDELDAGSVLIIPHGFPDHLSHLEKHGRFNVGMVSFRNDEHGRDCLARWRRRCIEWCYDRVEVGRFADQKYLDDWPEVHQNVIVLDRPGVGLAPWNFMRFDVDVTHDPPLVGGEPLVYFHFHGFKGLSQRVFDDGLDEYGNMPLASRRFLYGGYVRRLRRLSRELGGRGGAVARTGRGNSRVSFRLLLRLARHRRLLLSIGDRVIG